MAVERIKFLNLFLDVLKPEDIEDAVLGMLDEEAEGPRQIMLVNLWDIMRARRNKEFRAMLENAALVIPTAKSLVTGAAKLRQPEPVRYEPFSLIISVMAVLEKRFKTVYVFGGKEKSLQRAEKHIRLTFPSLRLIGRVPGYYKRGMEENIKTAMSKAKASLVVVGDGIPGKQAWVYRNRKQLPASIFIWDSTIIDIFAERKKRVSPSLFESGLEYLPQICKNPLRLFRGFQYLQYRILLVVYRRKKEKEEQKRQKEEQKKQKDEQRQKQKEQKKKKKKK